jgi:hypothetical protein
MAVIEEFAILEALSAVGGHYEKAVARRGIGERTPRDKLKSGGVC